MRQDDRVEFAAIPLALALLAAGGLLLLSASTEQWAWMLVAIPILAVALLVAWGLRSRQRPPPEMAPRTAAASDGVHRILVVADEGPFVRLRSRRDHESGAGRFDAGVRHRARARVPARGGGPGTKPPTPTRGGTSTRRSAGSRRSESTRAARSAHDPIQAADDALRVFAADELVFATHAASDANWLEQDVVEIARSRYELPVTHLVIEAPIRPDAGR